MIAEVLSLGSHTGMQKIREVKRFASPAPLPQALTWDGRNFWLGSLETSRLYKIDPESWEVVWETEAPGLPFGVVSIGDELRVLCGETEEDYRFIRRCVPGQGIDEDFKQPCPDDTGSQLSFDGQNLRVSQWYNQSVLTLNDEGDVTGKLVAPHGICGQVIVGDILYLATTDEEEAGDYWITQIDLSNPDLPAKDVALIPFPARSLAFDGKSFWTNHRANHEAVCFEI